MAIVHIDLSNVIKTFRQKHKTLSKRKFDKVTVRAINHTIRKARTQSVKDIRKTYGAQSRIIRKHLTIKRANSADPSAAILARGAALPLIAFSPKQRKKGVSVRISGKRKIIHKSFIATMRSGHTGVFARGKYQQGKFKFRKKRKRRLGNDLEINELKTLAVPMALNNKSILNHIQQKMQNDFPIRMQHLLSRVK